MSVLDTLVWIIVFHDIITHCTRFFLPGSLYGDVTSHLLQSQMDGWLSGELWGDVADSSCLDLQCTRYSSRTEGGSAEGCRCLVFHLDLQKARLHLCAAAQHSHSTSTVLSAVQRTVLFSADGNIPCSGSGTVGALLIAQMSLLQCECHRFDTSYKMGRSF